MKIGSGDDYDQQAQGSHWHVARNKQTYYRHSDEKRLDITRVDLVSETTASKPSCPQAARPRPRTTIRD